MNKIANINTEIMPEGYSEWRKNIEELIEVSKLRTALNVNMGTLTLYWHIGSQILEKQERLGWGAKVIEQLSADLTHKFPDDRGYSIRNLKYMRQFAQAYPHFPIVQVPLAQLENQPFWQVPLAESKEANREFVQPMGIAQYETEKLFADVASALPQIEDLENTHES